VTEQRYKAVLAVIGDGRTVSEVATDWGVSRRTMPSSCQPSPRRAGVRGERSPGTLSAIASLILAVSE
jgi:hypothetical protein